MKEGTSLISVREYYQHFYANKWDNSNGMGKALLRHKLLKLTQEEIENLNRSIVKKLNW